MVPYRSNGKAGFDEGFTGAQNESGLFDSTNPKKRIASGTNLKYRATQFKSLESRAMSRTATDWSKESRPGGKALRRAENRPSGEPVWVLQCDCGKTYLCTSSLVRRRKTFECRPCSLAAGKSATHRGSLERLYSVWDNMRRRCSDPKTVGYHRYGGRGIAVHESWQKDYAAFRSYIMSEMGDRPTPKHTIDRIDPDGNYEPGNIRWATQKEQIANRGKGS